VRQLALALQNHNDTFKTFPPLYFSNVAEHKANPELNPANAAEYYSWQMRILPFIEEDTLYKGISASSRKFTVPSTKVTVLSEKGQTSPQNIKIGQFLCPVSSGDEPDGNCNYVALSSTRLPLLLQTTTGKDGLPAYKQSPDGMIIPEKTLRGYPTARMADGTSKTALVVESREAARSNWYHPQESFVVGFLPADSTPIDAAASNYYPYFKFDPDPAAQWNFNPQAGNRTALNFGPSIRHAFATYHGLAGDPLERSWGPSSLHDGGIVIVGMGDGSVQEINADAIDPLVFFAAITARGGEHVPPVPAD
jgi:hypothetical protein